MKARNTTSSFSKREKCGGSLSTFERGAPPGYASCRVRDRTPKVRAGSIWVEPPGSYSTPSPIAGFHHLRRPGPSAAELPPAVDRGPAVIVGPRERRVLLQATSRKLWPYEHSRQPDESWCSIRPAIYRWLGVRFF